MSEKDILRYISQFLENQDLETFIQNQDIFGVSAKEIADHFNQYRSNVSSILNLAVKQQKLIKIESRPVLFLPVNMIKEISNLEVTQFTYSVHEFKQVFYGTKQNLDEPFKFLVGYNGSQATQVQQAQSAILYPPNGLHTLITGESGTGKTLFARIVHAYGKSVKKKIDKDYHPFVEFNCADYYHNPQLLLSQLFGHIRGAFTGANQESVGLVEEANGGILFLDEIHRLPPEGQELLFYLMDTGQYRKLGEANSIRKANVLIIGATTEDPNDVLLKTFKRRIPLSIKLPKYYDRPLKERLEMIERLFTKESIATQRSYIIDANIIKALATFDFPGNIGQLASEIKILCARSFLENQNHETYEINVPYEFLGNNIKLSFESESNKRNIFSKELSNYNFDMIISPTSPIQYQKDKILNEESYRNLIKEINVFSNQNLSKEQLAEKMNIVVTEYYNDVLDKMYLKGINKEEIYKIIDPEIVDFSIQIMKEIHEDLKVDVTQQHILVLSFHLKFLINRIKNEKIAITNKHNATKSTLVDTIIDKIENEFNLQLPRDERNFFQLLLKNMANENTSTRPELYILAHGHTASSLADVCNRLMNTNYVKAIDAPLSQNIEDSYRRFVSEIQKTSPKNGVMILADMGSLLDFGKRMSLETGVASQTIPNVTTLVALDLSHIMLNRNEHVDLIYNEYLIKNQKLGFNPQPSKPPAIISSCSSGKGTSVAFQSTIEEILKHNGLDFISVFTFSNTELQEKSIQYLDVEKNYNIIAIVGTVHLNTDRPFFHIANIVSKSKENNFINFIKNSNIEISNSKENEYHSTEHEVIQFLEKHVMYVNPVAAVKIATMFTNTLFKQKKYTKEEILKLKLSLLIHLGFMIERIIVDNRIEFENKTEFIRCNIEIFNEIKKHISIIEDAFKINIHDDEICYIIVAIESKDK